MSVQFFSEDISFSPENPSQLEKWIQATCVAEEQELTELNYIFCSDDFLYEMNKTHLEHNTLTDIITFDLSDNQTLEGEIYISVDRVR
ncbi:MAG: rRNA maturation factor, partial [Flavobacteriales bacterium]|nr:rRNA maturation factor [Flavobacteriales bacterium]